MSGIAAEYADPFPGGLQIDVGLVRGVLRHLQILLSDRAFVEQQAGTVELRSGQDCSAQALRKSEKCRRDVGALHPHQKLPLGDLVAQPGMHFDDPPRSHDTTGTLRETSAVTPRRRGQFRSNGPGNRRCQRKLLRVIDLEFADIRFGFHLHLGRSLRPGVRLAPLRFAPGKA